MKPSTEKKVKKELPVDLLVGRKKYNVKFQYGATMYKDLRGNTSYRKTLAVEITHLNPVLSKPKTTIGVAFCSPLDTFDKEVGRKIALARALDKLKADKKTRKQFYVWFFTHTKTSIGEKQFTNLVESLA